MDTSYPSGFSRFIKDDFVVNEQIRSIEKNISVVATKDSSGNSRRNTDDNRCNDTYTGKTCRISNYPSGNSRYSNY